MSWEDHWDYSPYTELFGHASNALNFIMFMSMLNKIHMKVNEKVNVKNAMWNVMLW